MPKETAKKEEALAKRPSSELAKLAASTFAPLEGFEDTGADGKEGIDSGDLKLAYLSIAQKTSAAIDSTEDSYIDGLVFGDMYNTQLKENYGRGPVYFLPLLHRKRAYLPDANGRMGEQIPWSDRRCEWPDEAGRAAYVAAGKKGKPKPEGVRVYDWVVLLYTEEGLKLAIISFKSKSFGAGQDLTTFVSMIRNGGAYTAKFAVTTAEDSNDAGKFYKFVVAPAGKPTIEEATFAKTIYASVKDAKLAVEDEPDDANEEAAGSGSTEAAQAVNDKKIPF